MGLSMNSYWCVTIHQSCNIILLQFFNNQLGASLHLKKDVFYKLPAHIAFIENRMTQDIYNEHELKHAAAEGKYKAILIYDT